MNIQFGTSLVFQIDIFLNGVRFNSAVAEGLVEGIKKKKFMKVVCLVFLENKKPSKTD